MRATYRSLLILLFLWIHSPNPSLAAGEAPEIAVPSGVKYQLIGTYDVERLNKILTTELSEFSAYRATFLQARHAVKLYRVTYPSIIPERSNRPTVASGLIAIPDGASGTLPLVSYQHGTVFSRTEVPSQPDESMETRLILAQFAAQGYIVVAADYFGKGISTETDGYLVMASAQQACLDMLFAARAVLSDLSLDSGPLFLSGWSQGAWNTMIFLRKLESVDIPVTAAVTASCPNDLFVLVNRWLHASTENDASFLPGLIALQLNAYEEYYQLPGLAQSAIKPEYLSTARDLYLNKLDWTQASAKLPARLPDMLREDFIASGSAANGRYWQILQDNQPWRWRAKTPLRTYYGISDEVVPPYVATLPVDYQKSMSGADTVGVEVSGENANHRGTFVHAVAEQKKWFDQFLPK